MTVLNTANSEIEALLRKTIENNTTEHVTGAYTPTPPITDATAIIHYEGEYSDQLNIIHGEGHVTTHKITVTDNAIKFNSTIKITNKEPDRITPADTVIHYDGVTCIQHGPGNETRVITTDS